MAFVKGKKAMIFLEIMINKKATQADPGSFHLAGLPFLYSYIESGCSPWPKREILTDPDI